MSLRILANTIRQPTKLVRQCYHRDAPDNKIGNREIVGHGHNGEPQYLDMEEFPFPAIRFKEPTPDILVSIFYGHLKIIFLF